MRFFVHEDLTKHHPNGEAKFLETPLRQLQNDGTFRFIIQTIMKRGGTLLESLLAAGFHLLGEAKALVPVDTGALLSSGFVRED